MPSSRIDHLILNSPYREPALHWSYNRETRMFFTAEGRRPAGYIRATAESKAFDDPGIFVELPFVNKIRPRVKAWREQGFPGVSAITKRLLEHWYDPEQREGRRFFFCQLEAAETMIFLLEGPAADRQGLDIIGDGGPFERLCAKMATGSGKTIVMAMLIAWHILNKVTYPQDRRFAKHVFVVAPGLTVKNRLQVLIPDHDGNYYDEFNIVPAAERSKLRQGKVLVRNWHILNWETDEQLAKKKTVDKRGAKSDEAYVREVLQEMAAAHNLVVFNDEAHHAWRVPANAKGLAKADVDEATKWIGGLDRIHQARGILICYDLSATPFIPSGKQSTEESLFGWIVSDFGLNDAIESGIVKTPRVVVRDDGQLSKDYKSRLYHLYNDSTVKDNLNRKAEEHEPLPDLVTNGYSLLGKDWLETAKAWRKQKFPTPPVMITVANRVETAARIKFAFDRGKIRIPELCDAERILHIDSAVLQKAEEQDEPVSLFEIAEKVEDEAEGAEPERKLTKAQQAELLRQQVDSVGQVGKPGEQIQLVISVGMLSEGWDAKTVTHIMGLRAFSSQLLCEQVVGRGLRRTSYDLNPGSDFFEAEYVNIFGVPFTFLPHEGGDGPPPPPPTPKTKIEPLLEKKEFEISWPNILRIDHEYRQLLDLELDKVKQLCLNAFETATLAEMAPIVEGKPDIGRLAEIDLADLARRFRIQKIVFETARDIFDQMKPSWRGNREDLLAQVIRLVDRFLQSKQLLIEPVGYNEDDVRRRLIITLNMNQVVQHIWENIRCQNSQALVPVFDNERPIRTTGDMPIWYTGRPCERTKRSHISHAVFDSTWEASEAFELDRNEHVAAWAKNEHLGFEILYTYKGVVHKHRPDYLVRMVSGLMLVLEVKGKDTHQDRAKREFLDEWVRAVNAHGGFGRWAWAVSWLPADVKDILTKHSKFGLHA
ncbi:MAG: DEAD/DEAH box helicase family protein [Gemmataceae bacterium]|nr:DEAD/DEAH box helicase family protein [Gemmataceae bacterium]MCI0742781.1 DEAD/DEAH box helicase family protein [Gemmataceae bacterium]